MFKLIIPRFQENPRSRWRGEPGAGGGGWCCSSRRFYRNLSFPSSRYCTPARNPELMHQLFVMFAWLGPVLKGCLSLVLSVGAVHGFIAHSYLPASFAASQGTTSSTNIVWKCHVVHDKHDLFHTCSVERTNECWSFLWGYNEMWQHHLFSVNLLSCHLLSSTGTLLPRLPSEPGMSLLTIKIEKIGLKDAGQCIDPYMTISVKGIDPRLVSNLWNIGCMEFRRLQFLYCLTVFEGAIVHVVRGCGRCAWNVITFRNKSTGVWNTF